MTVLRSRTFVVSPGTVAPVEAGGADVRDLSAVASPPADTQPPPGRALTLGTGTAGVAPVRVAGACAVGARLMASGVKGTKAPHGTLSRYTNHGCRCAVCRQAATDNNREYRHRTGRNLPRKDWLAEVRANPVHGTEGGYQRGCNCEPCRIAARVARQGRRMRAAA